MTRLPFVDAHFHLWDHGRLRYPWLDDPAMAAIRPSYTIADYRRETAGWNVVGCVHVDAGADPDDNAAETDWLNSVADEGENRWPTAIVARVALDDPAAEAKLAWQAARPRVAGIRHLVNWHPVDRGKCAYPVDLTRDPAWRRGYALLATYGLCYDFLGHPPQLAGLAEVAGRHPGVPVIVNHLGMPSLAEGLEEWRAGMTALAALPHVSVKLSGAGFVTGRFDPDAFAPVMREVIDLFGTARCMVTSNFPTDRLFADLGTTLGAYETILAGFSDEARRDLWGRNANRIYGLGLDL